MQRIKCLSEEVEQAKFEDSDCSDHVTSTIAKGIGIAFFHVQNVFINQVLAVRKNLYIFCLYQLLYFSIMIYQYI